VGEEREPHEGVTQKTEKRGLKPYLRKGRGVRVGGSLFKGRKRRGNRAVSPRPNRPAAIISSKKASDRSPEGRGRGSSHGRGGEAALLTGGVILEMLVLLSVSQNRRGKGVEKVDRH